MLSLRCALVLCLSIFSAAPLPSAALKTCTTGDVACYSSIPPNPCSMGGIAQVPAFTLKPSKQRKKLRKRVKARVPVVLKGANVVTSASHWSPRYLARQAKRMQLNDVRGWRASYTVNCLNIFWFPVFSFLFCLNIWQRRGIYICFSSWLHLLWNLYLSHAFRFYNPLVCVWLVCVHACIL